MKYKGYELRLTNKRPRIVMPKPLLVELKDWNGNKEEIFVEPSSNWYTIIENYGNIKNS